MTWYVVRYLHTPMDDIARFYPMSREDALATAQHLERDGEQDVMIDNPETGETWTVAAFRALR